MNFAKYTTRNWLLLATLFSLLSVAGSGSVASGDLLVAPNRTVIEGFSDAQAAKVRAALKEAGLEDADVLIKGADMPDGYFGMTLGDEGFVINRAIIDDATELGNTLRHELQHVLDRRRLGDPNAIGDALEEAARAAERGR